LSSSAVGAHVNVRVFEALVSARTSDSPSATSLTSEIARYEELQTEQQRAGEASRRVSLLFPHLVERFRAAQNAARAAAGDPRAQEAAAFEMRTFLHKPIRMLRATALR
jgi:hypothetical protein